MADLNCWKEKASKLMKELRDIGLVKSVRRGLGKPNLTYVMNFATVLKYRPKTVKEQENPIDNQKFGNRTSAISEIELLEVRKSNSIYIDLNKNDFNKRESEKEKEKKKTTPALSQCVDKKNENSTAEANGSVRPDVQVDKPIENGYGDFKCVRLTDKDYNMLVDEFGVEIVKEYIDKLDLYIASKGKDFASHLATIKKWIKEDARKTPPVQPAAQRDRPVNRFVNFKQRNWDYAAIEKSERQYILDQLKRDGSADNIFPCKQQGVITWSTKI